MTQEQKELLFKDLCARLPYGVKVRYSSYKEFITCTLHSITPVYDNVYLWSKNACFNLASISKIKPYLFPMSSMTEEQKMFLKQQNWYIAISTSGTVETTIEGIDWLNKNHFDYRGLIPMGLAIPVTKENNPYK